VTLPDAAADEEPPAAALELAGALDELDELDEPLLHAATAKTVAVSRDPIAYRALLLYALLIGELQCFKTTRHHWEGRLSVSGISMTVGLPGGREQGHRIIFGDKDSRGPVTTVQCRQTNESAAASAVDPGPRIIAALEVRSLVPAAGLRGPDD